MDDFGNTKSEIENEINDFLRVRERLLNEDRAFIRC
jgi:hypothetical protein